MPIDWRGTELDGRRPPDLARLILGATAPRTAKRTAARLTSFAHRLTDLHLADDRDRYLDLGCGNGFLTQHLLPLFTRSLGIDVELQRLVRFRRGPAPAGRTPTIARAEAERIPAPDAAFDLVTAFEVLEHLPLLDEAVDEMVRVTRPGGLIVVSTPQVGFPIENHGMRWRGRDVERKIPLLPYLRPLHRRLALARVFSSRELDRLFGSRHCEHLATDYVAPQFERAAARADSWERRFTFLRGLLDRLVRVPALRVLAGVSILKAYRKRS